jgi:hypothetical protein
MVMRGEEERGEELRLTKEALIDVGGLGDH